MLYNLIFNYHKYIRMMWDVEQIDSIAGFDDVNRRIEMNGIPIRQKEFFSESLKVSFKPQSAKEKKLAIPDLCVLSGRLYLNEKAYEVLHDLIQTDGEFLDLIDDRGQPGYLFNPLRVAEDVDGLDVNLSKKDQWGQVVSLAFHEDKVKDWNVFRTEFNTYMQIYCQEQVKDAIETAGLTGLYITNDLANIFPEEQSAVTKLN